GIRRFGPLAGGRTPDVSAGPATATQNTRRTNADVSELRWQATRAHGTPLPLPFQGPVFATGHPQFVPLRFDVRLTPGSSTRRTPNQESAHWQGCPRPLMDRGAPSGIA